MQGLLHYLEQLKESKEIIDSINTDNLPIMISGVFDSQKAHIAAYIISTHKGPCIFVAQNELQAKDIYHDLKALLGDNVVYYPAKEILIYDIEAEGHDISFDRLSAIEKFIKGNCVMVVSPEGLLTKVMPKEIFIKHTLKLAKGNDYDINDISKHLVKSGYQFSHMVEGKGQFSIRGEIIDIYPINQDKPYRIDFFDSQLETIKDFDIGSQRSIGEHEELTIFPASELIFDQKLGESAINNILKDYDRLEVMSKDKEILSKVKDKTFQYIEKIRQGIYFPGIEKLFSYFYDNTSLFDYLEDGLYFIDEFNKIEQSFNIAFEKYSDAFKDGAEKGNLLISYISCIFNFAQLNTHIDSRKMVLLNTFTQSTNLKDIKNVFSISSRPIPSFNGKINILIEDIKTWQSENKRIIILSGPIAKANMIVELFEDNDIQSHVVKNLDTVVQKGEIVVTHGSLCKGFEYSSIDLVVISDKELLGEEKKKRRSKKQFGQRIKVFSELSKGDYVVHQVHGIGLYEGIEKLKVEGVIKDYFKIQYQKGDLYVPVSQLDLIQKYIGSEGKKPKINRLGGTDWYKAKQKVKESLQDIAQELIRLYASRQSSEGHIFPEDNVWQRQFEETFPYEETEDQLKCIQEAKEDMQKNIPMDRLLCGDVGYGKTEVAMRAAFKCVMGGKQVAYLVPTTILAQQHYNNFALRMKDFPVKVEMLSRFRTKTQQNKIVKDLKTGQIDIIIGTHRILQKDIQYKDLGLVIVDEEQRFGVTHKEKLKQLKKNVDVLTLTATPIPRTLHMALIGVRDMSIISEPPEDRQPVQTYVLEYNESLVRDAILKEISRGGQVFYLHNRVESIHKVAFDLQKLVPEARVVYAHGQMNENELEEIILDFLDKNFDVLVCTTIIETGLDMPNVNTIVIEDADKMGLAQLYQLRGRVGRAKNKAYAYFTFRKNKILSEEAEKRLKAIKEFTEFGSGFKLAMRDLEIRGAGNLIGAEQHGRMNSVGYEMYCKLLEDSLRELKGEDVKEPVETLIDINISAHIDDDYIEDQNQKIEMYKKIAVIEDLDDIKEIKEELIDRYGDIPVETTNLIDIAYIKALCISLNILSVSQKNDKILFYFSNLNDKILSTIMELTNKYKRRILFTASNNPYLTFRLDNEKDKNILENVKNLLQNLKN